MSRTSNVPVPLSASPIASINGRSGDSRTPMARAIAAGHEIGIGQRSESDQMYGTLDGRPPATSSASLLLPAPPGPVMVMSLISRRSRSVPIAVRSRPSTDQTMVQRGERRATECAERWKFVGKVGTDELEELLGARHVLEAVPSQRTKRGIGQRVGAGDIARGARDDDLIAVSCGADARRDDDVHADVAVVDQLGLSGVHAHP